MNELESSIITMTRPELYDRVWSEPVRLLAPKLGLSDVGLRKVCKKYRVPLPFLGYWQQLRNGQSIRRIPLKKLDDAAENTAPISFDCNRRGSDGNEPLSEYAVLIRAEKAEEKQVSVPEEIAEYLPVVERTAKSIRSAKVTEQGLSSPKAKGCLSIVCSPALIDRALRIWNTLIVAFEQRGYALTVDSESQRTQVEVLGELMAVSMDEDVSRTLRPLTPSQQRQKEVDRWFFNPPKVYDYSPTGRIGLQVSADFTDGCRCVWRDSETRPLEKSLNSFLAGLVRLAERIKANRTEREAWERKCEEDAARRRERERLRLEEEIRVANLQTGFEQWLKAENLRRYIDAVRTHTIQKRGTIDPSSDIDAWIRWAERQADIIDPLIGNTSLPSYAVKVEPYSRQFH